MNHRVSLVFVCLALGLSLIVSCGQAYLGHCFTDDMYAIGYVVDENGDRLRDRLVVVFFNDEELGRDYSGEQGEIKITYEFFASSTLCRLVACWNIGAIKEGEFKMEMVEGHKRAHKVYQGESLVLPEEIMVNRLRITEDGEIVPAIENDFEPSPPAPPALQPDGLPITLTIIGSILNVIGALILAFPLWKPENERMGLLLKPKGKGESDSGRIQEAIRRANKPYFWTDRKIYLLGSAVMIIGVVFHIWTWIGS